MAYEVEFISATGGSIAVQTVEAADVRAMTKREAAKDQAVA